MQRLRALVAEAIANEVANGAHDHLTAGVVALEEIRLPLIRINEGTATVESLTAQIAAAREIGEAVDRMLKGGRMSG